MGSGATVGAGMYPAKYSFSITNASCASPGPPDFVVFNTGLAGTSGQASIVAYDNLYGGCSGTVPSTYWQYNTDGGTISTSVVLSGDGSQISFVQALSGVSNLSLLKWAPSASLVQIPTVRTFTGGVTSGSTALTGTGFTSADVGAIVTGTAIPTNTYIVSFSSGTTATMSVNATATHSSDMITVDDHLTTAAGYRSCTAPCMANLTLNGSHPTDTRSETFYDYTNDIIYVGDDSGVLHKFTNVFVSGTPTEATPVTVHSGFELSSPVFDSFTNLVFVGDSDGELSSVNASGTVVTTSRLSHGLGIVDAPIVDTSAQVVYVFAPDDEASSGCTTGSHCTSLYQLPTTFSGGAGSSGTTAHLGIGSGSVPVYAGTPDNAYFNTDIGTGSHPSTPRGSIYGCGNTGGAPVLYQVSIDTGALGTVHTGPTLTSASGTCSPITEIDTSTSTDLIFLSVTASGNVGITAGGNTCTGACAYSFNVTSFTPGSPITTSATAANGLTAAGGTSGIIIDNIATTPSGTSQIYFSTLSDDSSCGEGGCAEQAAQSTLR